MTRINLNVPVKILTDSHLTSEAREVKRINFRLEQRIQKNKFDDIPAPFYTAPCKKHPEGKFHELYWLDKGYFTYSRYLDLLAECKVRGFNVQDFSNNWAIYQQKPEYWKDLEPSQEQFDLMEERILSRCKTTKKPLRYYKQEISFEDYLENIWIPQKECLVLH